MLKKSILFFFIAIASFSVKAQEGWFKQKINDKVTINFPVEPKKINEQNYGVKDKDSVVFIVTYLDLLKATGLSLEDFNANVIKQEFADEFMSGLTPTMPSYTFKAAKITEVKGNTTYYAVGRNEEKKSTVYLNMIFVDGMVYSLNCILPDGKDTKSKDLFLNNISVSK